MTILPALIAISLVLVETLPSRVEILFEFPTILPELVAMFYLLVDIMFEFAEMTLALVLIVF